MRRSARHSCLLLCLVVVVTLGAALRNDFVWAARDMAARLPSTASFAGAFASFVPQRWKATTQGRVKESYRPLANLSYALDHALWDEWPAGYHLSNLAWHLLAVCLLAGAAAAVLRDFGEPRAAAGGLVAGLALAAHPALAETAVWIENRGVLLCACLCLVVYRLFLRPGRAARAIGVGLYVLALLAHEIAVALPAVLALHAALQPDPAGRRRRLAACLPLFVLAGLFAWLRMEVLKSGAVLVDDTPRDIPARCWALAALRTVGGYFAILAAPVNLCSDRYFVIPRGLRSPGMAAALAGLAAWAAALAWPGARRRLKTFALLAGLAALLPVSNIVFIPGRPMADQRLYLPAVMLSLLPAAAVSARRGRGAAGSVWLVAAWLVALAALTNRRVFDFRNDYVFWREAVKTAPLKIRCNHNFAAQLRAAGLETRAAKVLAALTRRSPQFAAAYDDLGVLYARRGRREAALRCFLQACARKPDNAAYLLHAAAALSELRRYDEALIYLERAKASPAAPALVWRLSGDVYKRLGMPAKAAAEWREAERRARRGEDKP